MGCDYYVLPDGALAHFSDNDDQFGCLCTFPFNDENDTHELDVERVKSLALLGASVVLHRDGRAEGEYVLLPGSIPAWMVDGIRRIALAAAGKEKQARVSDVELSDLRSLVARLTFALGAERAYANNKTGENAARRKLAWAGLSDAEKRQVKRMEQSGVAALAAGEEKP